MADLKVAKLGNPVLRQSALPVNLNELNGSQENEIQTFIDDLIDTMRTQNGVGIAAPQVSRSLQIIVVEADHNERYPDRENFPLMILINPEITYLGDEKVFGWEGCLSLNNLRGLVPRSSKIKVEAYDRQGKQLVIDAEGFLAVVLQHEIDHLHGKIFLDRMTDPSQLVFEEELGAHLAEIESVKI